MVNKCDKNLGKSKLLGLEFSHLWIGQEVRFEVVEFEYMLKLESALLIVSC